MAEWIVDGQPECEVWAHRHPPLRPPPTARSATRCPHVRGALEVLRHQVPGRGAQAGRPLRVSPAYARHAALGAGFGEKSGWERVNWYASNAARRRRVAAPARLGGRELVARDRRRGGRHPRPRRACSTSLREDRGRRARARRPPAAAVRERRRPAGRPRHVHADAERARRHRVRPVGERLGEDRYLLVTGTAFGTHDRRWIARHAAAPTARSTSPT